MMTLTYALIFHRSSPMFSLAQIDPINGDTLLIVKNDALAAVLEEPVNVSTNSAVICWGKPEANSPVRLYQLKIEPAAPGDYNGGISGEPLFTVDVPVVAGKDRYCESIDGLEEDTRYVYTVTAMHSNGLAVQNVDRRSFSTKANCESSKNSHSLLQKSHMHVCCILSKKQ